MCGVRVCVAANVRMIPLLLCHPFPLSLAVF